MYLYQTVLYKDTSKVIGAPASSETDLADFEANYKAQTYAISSVELAETTMVVDKTYAQFKALIASPILWTDVKCVSGSVLYNLYLFSENPL